ncbi:MAG: PsiF family protein [Gammaproteobacteria bacterium]
MKKLLIAVAACCLASASWAATPEAKPADGKTAQQNKMTTCNAEAAGKKGDERKAFMKTCLSNKPAEKPATAQQNKMKTCNADAAGKKGDERKAFMKTCLSAK